MMRSKTMAVWLSSFLLAMASSLFTAARAQGTARDPGGFKIPRYGDDTHIVGEFVAPDGHLVLEFVYRDQGKTKADFYDTRRNERLFPDQETQIANDNALEARLVQSAGLRKLLPSGMLRLRDGTIVSSQYTGGTLDEWPYSIVLTLQRPGAPNIEKMVALKAEKPETKEYNRNGASEELVTRYRVPGIDFLSDGGDGFFAQIDQSPYLIHFDSRGNSTFFSGKDDAVLIPAEDLLRFAGSSTQLSDQMLLDKSDALLDSVAQKQKSSPIK
jgi:hypothetical protein